MGGVRIVSVGRIWKWKFEEMKIMLFRNEIVEIVEIIVVVYPFFSFWSSRQDICFLDLKFLRGIKA